jgi:hypothetical protein
MIEQGIAWIRAHPWEAFAGLYAALSVLNGVLDEAAPKSTFARVVHALLDRLSPFTRRNAVGTFKLPGAASVHTESLPESAELRAVKEEKTP